MGLFIDGFAGGGGASTGIAQAIERMEGDNLAVTLCTHFEDVDGEQDDNGRAGQ